MMPSPSVDKIHPPILSKLPEESKLESNLAEEKDPKKKFNLLKTQPREYLTALAKQSFIWWELNPYESLKRWGHESVANKEAPKFNPNKIYCFDLRTIVLEAEPTIGETLELINNKELQEIIPEDQLNEIRGWCMPPSPQFFTHPYTHQHNSMPKHGEKRPREAEEQQQETSNKRYQTVDLRQPPTNRI